MRRCSDSPYCSIPRARCGNWQVPGECEFRLLAVSTAARGQGVGQALVHACIERSIADGAQALVLWTQPTMLAAQRLYERLGFVRATERDHADPRGFMRMVYRLVLN
jgi:ribosomal protein S18 acetylase RimI-like enzyme